MELTIDDVKIRSEGEVLRLPQAQSYGGLLLSILLREPISNYPSCSAIAFLSADIDCFFFLYINTSYTLKVLGIKLRQ